MTPWRWWAGELDDDCYSLAEEATREDVIRSASALMKSGDQFRIIEARSSSAAIYEGADFIPFLRTRNAEVVTVGPALIPAFGGDA